MTAIIIPRRHYTQPQGRVTIAAEWVGRRPIFIWMPAAPGLELVGCTTHPISGASVVASEYGLAYKHSGRVLPGSAFPRIDGAQPFSLFAFCNPTNVRASLFSQRVASSDQEIGLRVAEPSVGDVAFIRRGVGFSVSAAGTYPLTGNWTTLAASSDGAIDKVFAGGRLVGSGAALSAPAPAPTAIGGLPDSTAVPYLGSLAVLGAFQSVVEESAVYDLHANPWQLFRADPVRIYSLPSGPISISWSSLTASNITPTTATLTIGGIVR